MLLDLLCCCCCLPLPCAWVPLSLDIILVGKSLFPLFLSFVVVVQLNSRQLGVRVSLTSLAPLTSGILGREHLFFYFIFKNKNFFIVSIIN